MYKEIYRVALLQNRSGKKLLLLYVYPVIIGDNTIDGIVIYATPLMIINEQRGQISNYTSTQSFKITFYIRWITNFKYFY